MSPRKRTISITVLSSLVSLVLGLVAGTAKALAWNDERTEATAARVVKPLEDELHLHLKTVEKQLLPGGVMHDFRVRSEDRDRYLVEAVAALCRANPKAACPSPAELVGRK